MQAYEFTNHAKATPRYMADLATVRTALRFIAKQDRDEVRVRLVANPDTKEERLRLLNGQQPTLEASRAWRVTPRGALLEIAREEWPKWF